MTVVLKYVGPSSGGAVLDESRSLRVTFVKGYPVKVSQELAKELLKNKPTHWVEVKEN